ncbi:hypothetical protein [Roseibacillus persicicus]|uniref:hypothetical protein n=1 Tax=Roseibacillus persicicus TaxID=454148 RepID=UPI00280D1045|nr:hypothetical protein [Roseibacillus persicicus]MDQ8190774.1 hypothetical protein [Roseibacillus persicicus]
MIIEATEEGGLCFGLQEERDWEIFELLVSDAQGRGEGWLAKRLGVMLDDEDWDEFVAPGLTSQFESEVARVRAILRDAFEKSQHQQREAEQVAEPKEKSPAGEESGELSFEDLDDLEEEPPVIGEVPITREDSGTWYSVLNQARLALEGKWKLAALEDEEGLDSLEKIEPERVSAYLRNRFYTRIQAMLLEFVLDL